MGSFHYIYEDLKLQLQLQLQLQLLLIIVHHSMIIDDHQQPTSSNYHQCRIRQLTLDLAQLQAARKTESHILICAFGVRPVIQDRVEAKISRSE